MKKIFTFLKFEHFILAKSQSFPFFSSLLSLPSFLPSLHLLSLCPLCILPLHIFPTVFCPLPSLFHFLSLHPSRLNPFLLLIHPSSILSFFLSLSLSPSYPLSSTSPSQFCYLSTSSYHGAHRIEKIPLGERLTQ